MRLRQDAQGSTRRRFTAIALPLIVAFAGGALTLAQARVTSTPAEVDRFNLREVVLAATDATGNSSPSLPQVTDVIVGGEPARIVSRNATGITIMPPPLEASGPLSLQLLDVTKQVLAQGRLLYRATPDRAPTFEETMRAREQERRDVVANSSLFYFFVALMFGSLLYPFVLAIYRGTSGTHLTDNKPLGLPVGSFRSILAFSLIAYLGFYVLTSILSVSYFNPPDFLLGIVATVVGFYFGSRSGEEGATGAGKTGTVRGTVRQGINPARGALIKFKRSGDGTVPYTRLSDINGQFELMGMTPGKYVVQATLAGVAPSEDQEIIVSEGSDHELELVFKAAAPQTPTQSGMVQGTVTRPDNSPAAQAMVIFSQAGVEKSKKATDNAGNYRVEALAAGEYDIEAALAPHAPSDKAKVRVRAGGSENVDLQLK